MKDNQLENQFDNDSLNLREELERYLVHWKWFLLGVIIAVFGAYLYLRYTAPLYNATTTIMIKDNQKSGISDELKAVADLGIVGTGSTNNTDNEIEVIKSRNIIGNVVDTLNLNISYVVEGRVIKSEFYENSPIKLNFLKRDLLLQNKDTTMILTIVDKNKFVLKNLDKTSSTEFNYEEDINSKLGTFSINKTKYFSSKYDNDIFINLKRKSKVIDYFKSSINITPISKNSSVLSLSIKNAVRKKAEDFLNELVRQYNIDAINDKNQVSEKTRDFIDERLMKISQDLAFIQDTVKNYKIKNNISGLSNESELVLEQGAKNNDKIIALTSELILAKGVYENLLSNKNETLPPNLGLRDENISESIINFNNLVVAKNKLSLNAGVKSPRLIQYKKEIETQKSNLILSIKNLISSTEIELNQIKKADNIISKKIASIPILERGIIDIVRQQEIISGLYSYLLKKKEETAISLAVTVPNAKIIDVAYSSEIAVSPKKKIIYLAALLLGLLIPFIIIYLRNLLDTKIHNKKDIEANLSVPFLGDIPKSESNEKIIVSHDARSSGSEAFRLIRTNLDFMLANNTKGSKFIFITSTTSGEGKSFISINLAATLALSNKKILLMGMDLRAPKVTEYLGIESKKGVTNYITNNDLTLEEIKFNIPEAKGLDIISSGAIPPNPAELLASKSIEDLFDEVRDLDYYDFIIVDTAPVNLVTDTLLISKYADMFLYVVRANYLDKRLLAVPEELYKNKRLPNMAIVLNDTDPKRTYGYGYGYGGYGGYGYGYLSEEDTKKPWYKKMFSK